MGFEFRVQSIRVGEAWWRVQGAGVTRWPRSGSRWVNVGASFTFHLRIPPPAPAQGTVLVVFAWAFPLLLAEARSETHPRVLFLGGCDPTQVTIKITYRDLFQSNQLLCSRRLESHFREQQQALHSKTPRGWLKIWMVLPQDRHHGDMGGALHLQVWLKLLPAGRAGTDNIVTGANIETVFILYKDISGRNVKSSKELWRLNGFLLSQL